MSSAAAESTKDSSNHKHNVAEPVACPNSKKQDRCLNNFCKIFSIFRRKHKPAAHRSRKSECHCTEVKDVDKSDKFGSSPIKFDRRDSLALASILEKCREEDNSNTDTGGEEGEYIIYIPRVSRSKLQKKYLDPLQKAKYDPVLIKPTFKLKSRKNLNPNVPYTILDTIRKGESISSQSDILAQPSLEQASEHNDDNLAYGDGVGGDDDGSNSKTLLFYVPSKPGQPLDSESKNSFKVHEKNDACLSTIEQRHATVKQNRERIMQERVERLRNYFEIWRRRKQVGEMKKKLAKDQHSLICSPPNMLESRFHHIHWLGRGPNQNNSVGRYFDKEENNVVALKIFSNKPFETILENLDNKLMAIQEIHALNHMNHKNIVKLLGYFELQDKYHLILESCDHSLRQEIDEAPSGLGTSVSKKMIKYILNGLHFCHQAKCLHRDLSPENILVCRNGLVKVADFDRSTFIGDGGVGSTSPTPGNFVYNSPEILAGDKEYGLPSDVWSLGIIFCELLTGKPPWNGKSAQSQLREIHNCVGPLLPRHATVAKLQVDEKSFSGVHNHAQLQQMFTTISAPCCSFIMKCLDVNPLCRFTCGELLQHQFMKGHYK